MRLRTTALFVLTCALGCADVLGLDVYETSGSGGGGTGTTSTSEGGGGSGGTGTTTTEGGGGSGGTATTSSSTNSTGECTPAETEACYDGPAGTEDVGACKAGTRTCDASGAWGACEGTTLPSLEICATAEVDESCDGVATCTGQVGWVRHFPAAGNQEAKGVAIDRNDDHIVAVGAFQQAIDFGGGALTSAGSSDAFVVKLDPAGNHVWSRRFGAGSPDAALAVAVDGSGRIAIAGRFQGTVDFGAGALTSAGDHDIFVVQLDRDGNTLWSKRFGDVGVQIASAVAVDASGDVYITGQYRQAPAFGATTLPSSADDNVFVARLSGASGEPVWARGFGAAGNQIGRAVVVNQAGALYLAAEGAGTIDFGGGALSLQGADILVARLDDADGAHVWSQAFGDATDQNVHALVDAGDGGIVGGGIFRGDVFGTNDNPEADAGVFKLDASGQLQWARRAGSAGVDQMVTGIAVDAGGFVVAAGNFGGSLAFAGGTSQTATTALDRFFVKLEPAAGLAQWTSSYPNATSTVQGIPWMTTDLAIDRIGRVAFATSLEGTTDFGAGPIMSLELVDFDVVIGQLAP